MATTKERIIDLIENGGVAGWRDSKSEWLCTPDGLLEHIRLIAEERPFPMQDGPPIPWSLAETVYRDYAFLHGKDQSLERLAERGGFGWAEVAIIFKEAQEKRRWLRTR